MTLSRVFLTIHLDRISTVTSRSDASPVVIVDTLYCCRRLELRYNPPNIAVSSLYVGLLRIYEENDKERR